MTMEHNYQDSPSNVWDFESSKYTLIIIYALNFRYEKGDQSCKFC